jgi:hypothetical protein
MHTKQRKLLFHLNSNKNAIKLLVGRDSAIKNVDLSFELVATDVHRANFFLAPPLDRMVAARASFGGWSWKEIIGE